MDYYNNLGLEYNGSKFNPSTDEYLGVIRFKTNYTDQLTIPYGISFDGIIDDPLPYTGNGFAGGTEDKYYELPLFIVGFYYAQKYSDAAWGMKKMSFAGIKNPHFTDAYIIICEEGDFSDYE